jgi:membrane protein DedA with SNARE-associated domain
MDDALTAMIVGGGLGAIATLATLEKFVPVMPSYVLLIGVGMIAADHVCDLPLLIIIATMGSVLGAVGWYGIGRLFGAGRCARLVERYGRFVLLSPELYHRLSSSYARNQFWVTLVGQTIPTVRIYLALPAGVIGLAFGPFVAATALGTLLWNTPLVTLGHLLRGTSLDPVQAGIAVLLCVVALEAATYALIRGFRRRKNHPQPIAGPCPEL